MQRQILSIFLLFFLPATAHAVYFPDGIDWTNPSQSRFVQSLYLNMLGRAPASSETQIGVNTLRRNDNRTARLRVFESITSSPEYTRTFKNESSDWKIYQAPDYNYNNGDGFWRYEAATTPSTKFQDQTSSRFFTESIAHSLANYYDAFCYTGDPCISNPELARDRNSNALAQTGNPAHACADPSNLNSQFKWVAINGTTYPRGIDQDTICLENSYFETSNLTLNYFVCDSGFQNCRRDQNRDLRASRSGTDNSGNPTLFFRDGSRLALTRTDAATDNSGVLVNSNSDSELLFNANAHECADPSKATSRFTWTNTTSSTEVAGIGANTVCMENHYYAVQRLTLVRYQCRPGFTDCKADPKNNLQAQSRTRVNGNPGLLFSDGTTLALTARDVVASTTNSRVTTPRSTATQPRLQNVTGADCANPAKRMSQFKWTSNGLNNWPDGIDGRLICQNNAYYEIDSNRLRYYSCQSNYANCRANSRKDINISQSSNDGKTWTLSNGDQLTLISR